MNSDIVTKSFSFEFPKLCTGMRKLISVVLPGDNSHAFKI